MRYFMGIDAGGTSCRARLVDAAGRVLGSGRTGTANLRIGAEAASARILAAAGEALAMAGLDPSALAETTAGLGIAGISRAGAREALAAQRLPFKDLAIVGDARIALLGAHGGRDGAIVIIGTGSIGLAQVDGREITVGGHGFPVSDGGSGADIGLAAIRQALLAHDGCGPESPLTATVLDRLGGTPTGIIAWMDQATATEYATLAPMVVEHAARGDGVGASILTAAADQIAVMVRVLIARGAPCCALIGGLADSLAPWLPPDIPPLLVSAESDPLDGALILARRQHAASQSP
ncbi:MAG: hypothetical protein RLY86_3504 [Pseudomonadota bacterium]|jgi:glucosamine kinase